MITVKINHQTKSIEASNCLETVLDNLKISKQGIAVAINNQIITKTIWDNTFLKENDNVTIIQATQGG